MAFRCPKCGSDSSFTIHGAVEHHETVEVDSEGDVDESSGGDIIWKKSSEISCYECGHSGKIGQFEAAAKKNIKAKSSEGK